MKPYTEKLLAAVAAMPDYLASILASLRSYGQASDRAEDEKQNVELALAALAAVTQVAATVSTI